MSEWMSVNVPMNTKKEKGQRVYVTKIQEIEELEREGWQVHEVLAGDTVILGMGGTASLLFVLKRE